MPKGLGAGDSNGRLLLNLERGEILVLRVLVHGVLTLFALDAQRLREILHLDALHLVDVAEIGLGLRANGRLGDILCHGLELAITQAVLVNIDRANVKRGELDSVGVA